MNNRPSPPDPVALGRLYLVPAPLDFGCEPLGDLLDSLPMGTLRIAARLTFWICENAKTTRAYLKRVGQQVPLLLPLQSLELQELPRDGQKKAGPPASWMPGRCWRQLWLVRTWDWSAKPACPP